MKHKWQDQSEIHVNYQDEDQPNLRQTCDLSKQVACAVCGKYWTKMEVMAGEHLMVYDDTRDIWVCVTCL